MPVTSKNTHPGCSNSWRMHLFRQSKFKNKFPALNLNSYPQPCLWHDLARLGHDSKTLQNPCKHWLGTIGTIGTTQILPGGRFKDFQFCTLHSELLTADRSHQERSGVKQFVAHPANPTCSFIEPNRGKSNLSEVNRTKSR